MTERTIDDRVVRRRGLLNLVGLAVGIACLAFFVRHAMETRAIEALTTMDWQSAPAAVALYLGSFAAAAGAWHRLLHHAGAALAPATSLGIFATAQFGKYLPGNVAHHIGRVVIARRFGAPARAVARSMLIENAIVLGLVALLGLPALTAFVTWPVGLGWYGIAASALLGCGLGGALWWHQQSVHSIAWDLNLRTAARAAGLALVSIALSSASLAALQPALAADPVAALRLVSLFCAAWIAGFVTPGAPAGLGVRELMLTAGLTPTIGGDAAVALALLFRAVTVSGDLIALAFGLALLRAVPAPRTTG